MPEWMWAGLTEIEKLKFLKKWKAEDPDWKKALNSPEDKYKTELVRPLTDAEQQQQKDKIEQNLSKKALIRKKKREAAERKKKAELAKMKKQSDKQDD